MVATPSGRSNTVIHFVVEIMPDPKVERLDVNVAQITNEILTLIFSIVGFLGYFRIHVGKI